MLKVLVKIAKQTCVWGEFNSWKCVIAEVAWLSTRVYNDTASRHFLASKYECATNKHLQDKKIKIKKQLLLHDEY